MVFERGQRSWNQKRKKQIIHVVPHFGVNNDTKTHPPGPYCYHPELFPERAVKNPPAFEFEIRTPSTKVNIVDNKGRYFGSKRNPSRYAKTYPIIFRN